MTRRPPRPTLFPSTTLFRSSILEIQSYTLLSSRAIANLFTRPLYLRDMILQMDRIGVGSLNIIVLTGFFTGAVLGIQSERDRKSTRLNSSHTVISYAVFCLK